MRTPALAAAMAVLGGACGELPAGPAATPVDAAAVSPTAVHADLLRQVSGERITALSASLGDARERLLPTLEHRAALDQALASVTQALNGGTDAQVQASAREALTALDAAAGEQPGAGAELDAIRLALDEVLASVQPPVTPQ